MAGIMKMITASSMTALKKEVQTFTKQARAQGMQVRAGWDPLKVQQTKDGYSILLHADH